MREVSLEDKVIETIKKYKQIEKGDKIVVAVSGGPDSICLLHLLKNIKEQFKIELLVAHVNHGLRENAKLDEKFVQEYCKKYNISCFVKNTDVAKIAKQKKIGLEEAGRIVRYEFFDEVLEKENASKIAVAHNSNDNSETVLMNLFRGSGTEGLKGIEPIREKIIRPLIETKREEIERYCKKNDLNPRKDESNDESIYTRNKIRNELIPFIEKEFNPNIVTSLNRLSDIAREETRYLNEKAKEEYKETMISEKEKEIVLDLKKFNSLDIAIKRRIILKAIHILKGHTKGIEKIHIEDIIKLCNNNRGNKYLTPNKNMKVFIQNGKINIEIK